jgi:DNA-binding MarR family transcriptional regulator
MNNSHLDLKLNALSSEFRRLILGLIYIDGPVYQSDILKHVKVESNKLAYHLNILNDAGLIDREYKRNGKNVSRYSIKEDGVRFLENIGAIDELKGLAKEFKPTKYPWPVSRNSSWQTRHQSQHHRKSLVTKRQVIAA